MSSVFIYFCAIMQILYYMQKQLEWKKRLNQFPY